MLGIVNNEVKDNRTEAAIRGALIDAYNGLPRQVRLDCITSFDQIKLISILMEVSDPSLACTMLGLCGISSPASVQEGIVS